MLAEVFIFSKVNTALKEEDSRMWKVHEKERSARIELSSFGRLQ